MSPDPVGSGTGPSGGVGPSGVDPSIRVLVADDQAIVRDGLMTVLDLLPDIRVVGEARDGEEACTRVDDLRPDVVLMDLRMPVLDGAAATARIVAQHPETAVLVLTTFADDASIMGALRAGARGYLTKDASRTEVATAVRAVAAGQTTLAAEVGRRLIAPGGVAGVPGGVADDPGRAQSGDLAGRFPELTAREADVLALIAEGLNNTEIAERLFVSVATVKSHINAIFAKLGVRDRARAIALVHSA